LYFFRLTIVVVLALFWSIPVFAQDWDVGSSDPPPTGDARPLPVMQLRDKPLQLMIFDQCEPDFSGIIGHTGEIAIRFMAPYMSIGFIPSATDSTLTLKLKTKNRGERDAPFCIPQRSFTLRVILGEDTALLRVDRSTERVSVEYRHPSALLVLAPTRDLDDNIASMQFMDGSTQRNVRDFVTQLRDKFGDGIDIIQLEDGYYPCLSVPVVERAALGRRSKRLSLNKTPAGYLVCVSVTDRTQHDAIVDWIFHQQQAELKRFKNKRG